MAQHNQLGAEGEKAAQQHLMENGFVIREVNWKLNRLELDIVAEKDGCVVYVEVKTRSDEESNPFEAIDHIKRQRFISAGVGYHKHFSLMQEMRFDVITIKGTPGNFTIEHLEDAVRPRVRGLHSHRKL